MKPENKYQLSAGYFGKLPEYSDFIKHNAGAEEIGILDKWIQEGILKAREELKTEWKSIYRNSPRYNFLYPFAKNDNIIYGIMFPGYDKSEREFPFLAFIIMNRKTIGTMPLYLMPLEFSGSFDIFNMEFKHSADGEGLSSFKSEINNLLVQNQTGKILEYQKYLAETSLKGFFERTLGSFNDPQKNTMLDCLRRYLLNPEPANSVNRTDAIKISFNLVTEFCELDIAFIINLLQALAEKSSFGIPVLFWTRSDDRVIMYVFIKRPSTENYYDLIYPDGAGQRIKDLTKAEDISPVLNPSASISLMGNGEISLKEFIAKIQTKNKWSPKFWLRLKK